MPNTYSSANDLWENPSVLTSSEVIHYIKHSKLEITPKFRATSFPTHEGSYQSL